MKKLYLILAVLCFVVANAQIITPNTAYRGKKLNISIVDCKTTVDVVSRTAMNRVVSDTTNPDITDPQPDPKPDVISQTSNINIFNQLNEFLTVDSYIKISDCEYSIKTSVPSDATPGPYSIFIPQDISGTKDITYNNACNVIAEPIKYTLSSTTNICGNSDKVPSTSYKVYDDSTGKVVRTICANWNGNFSILLPAGNYTVKPISHNPNYTISPTEIKVTLPYAGDVTEIQPFCATANQPKIDLLGCIYARNFARPGFDAKYVVKVTNRGNVAQSGSVKVQFNDAILDFVSSSSETPQIGNGTLTWNFSDLKPYRTKKFYFKLNVNSPVETPAVNIGDKLDFDVNITTLGTDINLANNSCTRRQTVVGSYDPNDKLCMDGDEILQEKIGDYLTYRIRFENTGNFPAEFIRVIDYINPELFDISTLEVLETSHDMQLTINDDVVEFFFENIQLPFDDDNNDGHIFYKIKTKDNLKIGQKITNQASIYFDYNAPIITNIAETAIVEEVLGTAEHDLRAEVNLYPNPTSNLLNIKLSNGTAKSIEIYDMSGQMVFVRSNTSNSESIDVTPFAKGTYIIKINTSEGATTSKFVKE